MNCTCSHNRRGFLALVLGGAAYAVPAVTALVAFLNPWRRQGEENSQSGEFIRVAPLADLKVDGPPQKFPVVAKRTDAWTSAAEPVGAVFLRRVGPDQVVAMQVECPHAGCPLKFNKAKSIFTCTCHTAQFAEDGQRLDPKTSMSPRDMDALDVKIEGPHVCVKFEKFCTATPEKIVKT
jgi:menaquinol-cytochrome c reductase iron-sulfur subunit